MKIAMGRQKNSENQNTRDTALADMVSQIQNEKIRNYINGRIIPQMKWYSSNSREYKRKYHRCMTVSILLGAFIPVVSVFADGSTEMKVVLAFLGASVTAINAYLSLHNYKDLWLEYRTTRERLLRILYCYFNDAGIFTQKNSQAEKDILLVNVCEEELSSEHDGWMASMNIYS